MNRARQLGASLTLAGLAAAGLVLLGCGSQEPSAANRAESDAITRRLSHLSGVVRTEGGYAFNASDPGSFSVLIEARSGTDLDQLAREAVGISGAASSIRSKR